MTPLEGLRAAFGERSSSTTTARIFRARPRRRGSADAVLVVAGYTHADEGEYIPPDIFADFLPSFPPPPPEYEAFAQASRAARCDTGMPLGGDRERLSLHPRDEALIEAVSSRQSSM